MSTGADYFDRMYREPDPWSFETSEYERAKYAETLAALPRPRYRRAFEPGCSVGVLSTELARRADLLRAVDIHPVPLRRARERLAGQPGVTVDRLRIPWEWPPGRFDLVVVSEVAYYFDDDDLEVLIDRVHSCLEPEGDLVLVHWRGPTDYPQGGDEVHDRWLSDARFDHLTDRRTDLYRLDVLRRPHEEAGQG